jgi:hypothetical protein
MTSSSSMSETMRISREHFGHAAGLHRATSWKGCGAARGQKRRSLHGVAFGLHFFVRLLGPPAKGVATVKVGAAAFAPIHVPLATFRSSGMTFTGRFVWRPFRLPRPRFEVFRRR